MKKTFPAFLTLILLLLLVPLHGYADYGAIEIDGYYDDWEDKPHTQVYYDQSNIHRVSVFRDESTVYVHIKMSENGFRHMDNYYFEMGTNQGTKAFTLELEPIKEKMSGTAGIKVHNTSNWQNVIGSGYYTREEGESDEAEFNILLSSITDDPQGIYDISIMCSNLGPQIIICVGAGTGPYMGIAIGAAIVLISLAYFYYRKRRPVINQ